MGRALPFVALIVGCYEVPVAPPTPSAWHVTGDGQTGVPGYRLGNQIVVRVADADGRAIVGDTIDFSTSDPYAAVEPVAGVVTDSTGAVAVYWRLGSALGSQSLSARSRVPGVSAATVSATSHSNYMPSIDGGDFGLCGVDTQGRLGCWLPPRLATADVTPHFMPVTASVHFTQVAMLGRSPASGIPPTSTRGCALADTGRPWCFTLDSLANVVGLVELAGAYPALTQLVSGGWNGDSYCGVTALGAAWCWGNNTRGELGDGTQTARAAPVAALTAATFVQLDVAGQTVCAITGAGEPWCWGDNGAQKAGAPVSVSLITTPTAVNTAFRFTKIRTLWYAEASCGFVAGGGMDCWGAINFLTFQLQLGFGATAVPTSVVSNPSAIDILDSYDSNVGYTSAFAFDQRAGIHYLGPQAAASVGSPRLSLGATVQPLALLGSVILAHGSGYLCGTAVLGGATLCPSQLFAHTDVVPVGGWIVRPAVVGVPFPP